MIGRLGPRQPAPLAVHGRTASHLLGELVEFQVVEMFVEIALGNEFAMLAAGLDFALDGSARRDRTIGLSRCGAAGK